MNNISTTCVFFIILLIYNEAIASLDPNDARIAALSSVKSVSIIGQKLSENAPVSCTNCHGIMAPPPGDLKVHVNTILHARTARNQHLPLQCSFFIFVNYGKRSFQSQEEGGVWGGGI